MLSIFIADLENQEHAAAILELLRVYARGTMGGGEDLSDYCKLNLIAELKKRSNVHSILAFADGVPAGVSICIEGFSTFACKPLLNIHDLTVSPKFRRQGISKKILELIEQLARQLGCCKITLEVLQGNRIAMELYSKVGFAQYELDPTSGGAIFMQKRLEDRST